MEKKTKTTASKTTRRATASAPSYSGGKKSGAKKAVTAAAAAGTAVAIAKKVNVKTVIIAVTAFVIALIIGAGACFILGKNDKFEINGSDELSLTLGETYRDEGVTIKEFGFDFSGKAKAETNLKISEDGTYYADDVGTYYISYTVSSLKFGFVYKVKKIRLVTFVEESESGE